MKETWYAKGFALTTVIALVAVVGSFAQPGQPPPRRGHGDAHVQVLPPLPPEIPGLTDQQKEQLKKLHDAFADKSLALTNQLGEKEARLRTLTTAKKIDEADVSKVVDEIGSLRHQLFKSHVMLDLKIRELLTEEQRMFFDTHPRPSGPPPDRRP